MSPPPQHQPVVPEKMVIRHPVPREVWNSFLVTITKRRGRVYDCIDDELEEALKLYVKQYG